MKKTLHNWSVFLCLIGFGFGFLTGKQLVLRLAGAVWGHGAGQQLDGRGAGGDEGQHFQKFQHRGFLLRFSFPQYTRRRGKREVGKSAVDLRRVLS